MPEKRLSRSAIREHFRKCLPYYLLGMVALLFFNNLVFTLTRPRVPSENTLRIYLMGDDTNAEALSAEADALLKKLQAENAQLKALEFQDLSYYGELNSATDQLLSVKLVSGEGDLYLTREAGFEALEMRGGCYPLDDFFQAAALNPEIAVWARNPETNQNYIAALRTDSLKHLGNIGAFENSGGYLLVAANGENIDLSLAALKFLLTEWTE